jgi:hypothetical protein
VRQAARLLALVGAVAIGAFLLRAAPRDVTLVYDLSAVPAARTVDGLAVEIRRGGERVRSAVLRVPPGETQVLHRVRLPDGTYDVVVAVSTTLRLERTLEISEDATIVLPLGPRAGEGAPPVRGR